MTYAHPPSPARAPPHPSTPAPLTSQFRLEQSQWWPGLRGEQWNQMRARLERAAPVLLGKPLSGSLRNDLIHALLSRTIDSLHGDVTRRLLPVAPRLAEV
jgi:hypothetical protein